MKITVTQPICALLFAALCSSAHAVLVTNGGFETGDLAGWTLVGDPDNTFVDSGFSHSGTYALWMGEIGGLGSLSQTLGTVTGARYNLSFWFAGDGDVPSQFQALIDSTVLLDVVNPPFDLDYVRYSFDFTAASSFTSLTFKFRDDPSFLNLDDVDVVQLPSVPEPSVVSLFALGGLFLTIRAAWRRRSAKPTTVGFPQ